jgi:ribonucleoside-diphosphate reductase alpha chain
MVQGNERIKMCKSILDYVFRELAVTYLSRDDLANVSAKVKKVEKVNLEKTISKAINVVDEALGLESDMELPNEVLEEEITDVHDVDPLGEATDNTQQQLAQPQIENRDTAVQMGYSGETCGTCNSMKVRYNGTCLLCEACGNTTGCS